METTPVSSASSSVSADPLPLLILAYGTLRPGLENAREMHGARHLGPGKTVEPYALLADAELPYAARTPAVCRIVGDIYEVTAAHLVHLDAFEGHPRWYRRELVEVEMTVAAPEIVDAADDQPKLLQCWLYFCLTPQGDIVPSGDYAQHLASKSR